MFITGCGGGAGGYTTTGLCKKKSSTVRHQHGVCGLCDVAIDLHAERDLDEISAPDHLGLSFQGREISRDLIHGDAGGEADTWEGLRIRREDPLHPRLRCENLFDSSFQRSFP